MVRFLILLLLLPYFSFSQAVQVPDEMVFLDMKINIKNSAKDEIASTANLLRKNRTYFQAKIDRIDAYFPIIEKVFTEEGVPEDFKFLAVQESSLVSDAVSTSNAVGFWQFKRESAIENGLRIDNLVDERKNISASTRAAANYLKKSNKVFNNWIYALMSYNVGFGGTQRTVDSRYYGAREMDIDGKTHWYILKCIAHKLAFAEEEGKNSTPPLVLFEYFDGEGKTWSDLAGELSVEEGKLKEYNKWLNHHTIPDDKDYVVLVPSSYLDSKSIAAKVGDKRPFLSSNHSAQIPAYKPDIKPLPEPKKTNPKAAQFYPGENPIFVLHNGIEAIKAKKGDDINKLAIQASISRNKFLKNNDLRVFDQLEENQYYYIKPKKNKANVLFHIVKEGENLRDVSQMYGVTISSIQKKNRMAKGEPLQPGRELWLRNKRPEEIPVKIIPLPKPTLVKPPKSEIKPVQKTITVPTTQIDTLPRPTIAIPDSMLRSKPTATSVTITETLPRVYYKDTIHTVLQGQSLFAIARLYNTKVDSLKNWNTIDSSGIKINQILVVKKQVIELKQGYISHVVATGETFYRIADLYKVPVKSLQEWSNKKDFSLSVGEVLFIKKP
jgi:membrane-bound lytic murein transglycosylase D